MTVYDAYDFPADGGTPTLTGKTSVTVLSSSTISKFQNKLISSGYIYKAIFNRFSGYITCSYYSVTAATARSLAVAGDYIEDVKSENPDEYPDNGPLGLYFYIKQ